MNMMDADLVRLLAFVGLAVTVGVAGSASP